MIWAANGQWIKQRVVTTEDKEVLDKEDLAVEIEGKA